MRSALSWLSVGLHMKHEGTARPAKTMMHHHATMPEARRQTLRRTWVRAWVRVFVSMAHSCP
jgi:hypothetical protein